MKCFTGYEYLLLDIANNANLGLDKKTFEERLEWVTDNINSLELLAVDNDFKERPLYIKAVQAVRKAQAGNPTGHLVGFDAVCSGAQIMSALTGCEEGANATGLIDPNRRADAYTQLTGEMVKELGHPLDHAREKTKNALMTSLYGSKAEPKKEFGDGTPELNAFYKAMFTMLPGACQLLSDFLNSWQPYALAHEWRLPDGFLSRVKVMQCTEKRLTIDELSGASMTYQFYVNQGEESGVKNAANITHSVDAYVLRSLVRRCNYDHDVIAEAYNAVLNNLFDRATHGHQNDRFLNDDIEYYRTQYERSGIADIVIAPHLTGETAECLSTEQLQELLPILETMIKHKPFEIVTVHDDFKCHPNHMNHLRSHYRDILAELADSELASDILSQIHGVQGTFTKLSPNLGDKIRNSNYALS